MELLSEDDQNLRALTWAELEAAWDLWFDLAQHTNDFDPPYTHGVFQGVESRASRSVDGLPAGSARQMRRPGDTSSG